MARTVKELLEQRAKLVTDSRKVLDACYDAKDPTKAPRALTAEEDARFKAMNAEIDSLKGEIDTLTRQEKLEAEMRVAAPGGGAGPLPGREDLAPGRADGERDDDLTNLAFEGWFAQQSGKFVTDEQVEAARALRFNLHAKEIRIPILRTVGVQKMQAAARGWTGPARENRMGAVRLESRDMVVGTPGSGGYLTPPGSLVQQFEAALLAYGGVYEHAEILRTTDANPIMWPGVDDTGNVGELIAEGPGGDAGVTSTDPTVTRTTFNAFKISSKPLLVSTELLRDNAYGFDGRIFGMLGERIGRKAASLFATGDGASKPRGIVPASTLGKTAASASAITLDEVLDLVYSVDPAYRKQGCGFLMHDSTVLHLRKKKLAAGEYAWQPGAQAGQPDQLFTFPVYPCQEIATITNSAKTIVFGLLSAYKVRQVAQIRIYRLVEVARRTDQDVFYAYMEYDGDLIDAGTHPVKHLIQAA